MTTGKATFLDSAAAWTPVIVLSALCLSIILGPALSSQFGPTDDHEIALMLGPDRYLPLADVPGEIARHVVEGNGRFRPVYWILRVLETAVWGWDPRAWYIDRLVLAVATVGTGAWLASLFAPRSIAILAGLFVIVGPQAEAWFRLGPQEAYAVPLALGGLALIGRRHATTGLILLLLSALTKESFVPFAIVGVGWAWYLGDRRQAMTAVVGLVAVTAGTAIMWITGGDYYAQDRSLAAIGREAAWMVYEPAVAFGWPLLLIAAAVIAPKAVRWPVLTALAIGIVAPQAIIYAGLGWSPWVGRYLLPAVFACVAAAVVGLSVLASRHALLGAAGMILAGTLALQQSFALAPISNGWAVTGIAFQASLAELRSAMDERPNAVLIVRPTTVGDFEYIYALRRYLPQGTAMLEPPSQAPVGGAFEVRLMEQLVGISADGGAGYTAWEVTDDCIELDIRRPREDRLCPVAITFY